MSLQSFQRAVVDLTLAPQKVRAVRQGDSAALIGYDLTERERNRIFDIVRQRGISVHCSLSRGNRLEAVMEAFPMTCFLLRPVLRQLIDELCEVYVPSNYQLVGERMAFAAIVSRKLSSGELTNEYLVEIFGYEAACLDLLVRIENGSDFGVNRVVEFRHPPEKLVPALRKGECPPAMPDGLYRARIRLERDGFVIELIP